ncbi:hypothetical protein AVEN_131617-1 [Araneus ventricosus]|uniref:Basigin n=1 Tax=Araneus ventricosus TaxID=182803 RepID=A0A4Y2EVM4_ARAVE|nr:hypothetical protein AVEN_131617-1 [Araneus ventricosus]
MWDNARGAVNWMGRVQLRSWPFLVSQMALVFQNKTSLLDSARISNNSYVRALVSRGEQEIFDDDKRVKLLDHEGLKRGKFLIEEANFDDRNHYTCEAYNQLDSVNTTVFIRVKDKLAALWPFLGICAEVAILCSIIFVYERRKSMNQCDEPDTDLPADK